MTELDDIIHAHYVNAAALEAATGDHNWAFEYANNRLAVNHAGTFYYFENSATAIARINGTTNRISKFTSASTVGNSNIYDNGATIGLGIAQASDAFLNFSPPSYTFGIADPYGFKCAPIFGYADGVARNSLTVAYFQAKTNGDGASGGVNSAYNILIDSPSLSAGSSISSIRGLFIADLGGGTARDVAAIYINPQTSSSTPYAIFTNAGLIDFGDAMIVRGSTIIKANFDVYNASSVSKFSVAQSTGNTLIAGTLGVTGVSTFTAAPIFSSGTASQTMELNGSKALVTVAITGTGNYVKSASPTLTGTLVAASATFSGTVGVTGDFAVNTNKFTVAASSGNTLIAGTLTVSTFTSGSILYAGAAGLYSQNNSKFFWDNTNQGIFIGDNASAGLFLSSTGDFHARGSSGSGGIAKYRATSIGNQNYFVGDRANGNFAVPTALVSGDFIVSFLALGYHGTGGSGTHCSEMRFLANENWSAGTRGSRIDWYTIQNGSSSQDISLSLGADGLRGLLCYGPISTLQPVKGGVAVISTWPFNSGFAMFSHTSLDNTSVGTNYGLLQQSDGATYLNASATKSISFNIGGTNCATLTQDGYFQFKNRWQGAKAADVASANDITIVSGNYFILTGTTTVNRITLTGWQAGSEITIQTSGSLTLAHQGAANTGTLGRLNLFGSANVSMTANDFIKLMFNGTEWFQSSLVVAI